ncbi:DUF5634 family protein [Geomonas sp. Red69]|uniref:DUF5634 family protein n=1 Tax=Geomonas diazotrophica TaxID=2843197 RepID=A0ABX8JL07_9BACT|nr:MULTISPECIES: PilZ-like domain-containing protein [Geomonas]MBU5635155.1 DUF5634 family protein [Geomonas diazotrophica]QWV97796.1 DUF5634 family protein [Geomonas nitrogeniifigens]QXE86936.1 DUF5634 family protein [Geomonas nitrogeniifigens]
MAEELEQYARYFHEGLRVRVGIPLEGGGWFPEWGMVATLDDDLLLVDLSRDQLPEEARLETGHTLNVGLPDQEQALTCRAVLVRIDAAEHRLALRLIEDVYPFEPREYYRQDVYLPLDYRLPLSQIEADVRLRWLERRREMEFAAQTPEPGEPEELEDSREEIRARLEKRRETPPVAANISGGGLRININEKLIAGQLIELSIYIPNAKHPVEIVGEVVEVRDLTDQVRFSTAVRYRMIDEADRDRLIGYISAQQLLQLSQQTPRVLPSPEPGLSPFAWRLQIALAFILLVAFIGCQVRAIRMAKDRGEKWEVQRIFDEGFVEFLKRQR